MDEKNKANQLTDMLKALGAMAEMNRVYYDHLIRVKFTPHQALELCKAYTHTVMTMPNNKAPTDDGMED